MMHFIRFNCLVVLLLVLSVDARHRVRRGARSGSGSAGRSSRSSEEYRQRDPRDKPNFVLFFADDMGYGDLASYGHPTQERGPIDDIMVEGGIRFTQGYVPDTVCTPSRTALLTGRYPVRSGVFSSPGGTRVFQPSARTGLPSSELTLAEALKTKGYTTGIMGKWHLGLNSATRDDGAHLPMNHGFDFVGHILPFTHSLACDTTGRIIDFPDVTKCFLYKRDQIVAQPYNHTYLTQTFVNDAVSFIEDNADNPFFLYFPFAHPHATLFASPQFAGKSRRGEYGDNINEMSWAVGEVINALQAQGLSQNTLVLFISDHGPQPEYCAQGGDASIFKGFGHPAPRTGNGQLFCMFYAIIGIGITGSILLSVGEILQGLCLSRVGAYIQTFMSRCSKAGPVLANIIFVYLLMIIPTSLIYFFTQSDWSYIDSHYFSVVAMTTIGFGDLEPRFKGISVVELYVCRIVLFSYLFFCLGAVSTMLDMFSEAQRQGSSMISSRLYQYKKIFSLRHREAGADDLILQILRRRSRKEGIE